MTVAPEARPTMNVAPEARPTMNVAPEARPTMNVAPEARLTMNILRIFPTWRLSPRYEELEVAAGTSLRDTIAGHFGIDGRQLVARNRYGEDVGLDALRREESDGERLDLAVSLRPLLHPFGLFEEARATSGGAAPETGETDLQPPEPQGWPLMSDDERVLAGGLGELGFGLEPGGLDPQRLVRSFREVPAGYESSPYRIFFAAVATLSEQGLERLDQLDERVEALARGLKERLRLNAPDALDLRLHLFVEPHTAGDLLRQRFAKAADPVFQGAVYGGWRRVVVHPYLDEPDRLAQMANLGRRLAVERLDAGLRGELQRTFGELATSYDPEAGCVFDYQGHVSVRPAEEELRTRGELALLSHLEAELAREPGSSGMARNLAHRILSRAGLRPRYEVETSLLREMAWPLARETFQRRRRSLLGDDVDRLDRNTDEKLREWLRTLAKGLPEDLLDEEDLRRTFKTVAVDVACRLRFEIEQMIEQETLPPVGEPDHNLAQFLATMEVLGQELRDFSNPDAASPVREWLGEREAELAASVEAKRLHVLSLADPLFSKLKRWLPSQKDVYSRLAEEIEELECQWLELRIVRFLLQGVDDGQVGRLFELADDLIGRFQALRDEIPRVRAELAAEIEQREKVGRLGTIASAEISSHLLERLERDVRGLSINEALRSVVRHDGQLRDLFHLRPETLLVELTEILLPALTAKVEELAAEVRTGELDTLLRAALEELFVSAPVQPSGRAGRIGALDGQTRLLAFYPPPMRRQLPNLEERLRQHLERLDGVEQPPPVVVLESAFAPGLILTRSVQALPVEELVP